MTSQQPASDAGFWPSIREALRGTHRDYTTGSIDRAILLLAIPMVLEMAMESLFGIVNVFWVSSLGADAIAAVGVTESILTLVFAVAIGLSMSLTATVARRIGEQDHEGARVAAGQGILLGSILALVMSAIGIIWGSDILLAMAETPSVVKAGAGYTRLILGSSPAVMMLFLINAIFRGAGDATVAMRSLWIGNVVNMILDPLLIFGWGPVPAMGIQGAAIASTIGRSCGVAYQLSQLFAGSGQLRVTAAHFRPQPAVLKTLLTVGLPGVFQFIVGHASWIAMIKVVAMFGAQAMAGTTIAIRIIIVTILPSWGLSNAAATLVGQNLGAGHPRRAEHSVWRCGIYNAIFLGFITVLFIAFAEPMIGFFSTDPLVVSTGVDCLRYIAYGYVFYAFGMVMVQAFNGAGDTWTPTWINMACQWAFQIPMAYLLAKPMGLGPRGVFMAITIGESVLAVVAAIVFRRGSWKDRKI
ncbi:MAG: MATE family efflux transporter [Acidobacteria bacterium]|nr:MATE family efflux transporter [Acidobacteriota bacterium]